MPQTALPSKMSLQVQLWLHTEGLEAEALSLTPGRGGDASGNEWLAIKAPIPQLVSAL